MTHPINLHQRAELLRAGHSDRDLRTQVMNGELRRYWRGIYGAPEADRYELAHRTVLAAARTATSEKVVSHQSAAVLHNLPLLDLDLGRVHFTADRRAGGTHRTCVIHAAPLRKRDVVQLGGVRVTSVARTAVDVARASRTFPSALAVFDAALRSGVTSDELQRVIAQSAGRKGVAMARHAFQEADGLAESPGESWSRFLMSQWSEIPPPTLQCPIRLETGEMAYADFGWYIDGRLAVIGEFDGMVKYRLLVSVGDTPSDVVIREKHREDLIRALGIIVVRWTWADLQDPHLWRARLRRALAEFDLLAA
ncbi:hypothetical protein [Yimella sp. cx-51]|uniref:type IV toxin-antitoxin system AbiEi family antitoxin domain-containing protein n=1 Tax=Yimella sp. cx-51 TaxID=2770551 RepID=UPI00165E4700|nr:hypothetical protein [Yimella sp. cx-51]MBC9956373.1 hypothetical protein [Yimella sp. cx-51]QTH38507.1 hypothetical protein J5M86_02185 [Yimella sp. cx-51]